VTAVGRAPVAAKAPTIGEELVPAGPALALRVAAVERLPDDVAVGGGGVGGAANAGFISLTPAFYRAYKDTVVFFPPSLRVRLERGQADVAAFAVAIRRLTGGNREVTVIPRPDLTRMVEQGIRAQAVALALFAALAGAAALVVVGQTLTRELSVASTGQETVRALGASRGHLLAAMMLPIGLVGVAGALVGAGLAVLASPLTPMGLALKAEPAPGLLVHLAGLGVGMLATLLLVVGRVAVTAWRLAEERPYRPGVTGATGTTSTLADTAARAGLPPTSVAGLRMALEQGRGPRAVPVRVSLVGVTVGIIALTAAITFGASLDRLLDTPRLYGWDFDAATGDWRLDDPATSRPAWLATNPQVGAWSAVWISDIQVEGTVVTAASFDTAGGRVFPTLVEGREPSGPDELVLGAATLRRLGLRLGQTVRVKAGRPAAMRIVGSSALVRADSETAGDGAILTIEGLRRSSPAPTPDTACSTSASHQAPTRRWRARACGGCPPGWSRWSRLPSRRPRSTTWAGSVPCPTCSPGCSPCWPPPPWPTCWSPRCGAAATTWPSSSRWGSSAGRCRPRWPGRRPRWRWSPWPSGCRWGSPSAAGPGACWSTASASAPRR
jgi:hypothetical protein